MTDVLFFDFTTPTFINLSSPFIKSRWLIIQKARSSLKASTANNIKFQVLFTEK